MSPNKACLLREKLRSGRIVRVAGAHNGLGARLVERNGFDGVWASGLEISTAYGLPDANILTMTESLEAARAIHEATRLPVVCDCDTGYGNASNVKHMVKRYEAAGLAAIVIEDKQFPKVNSLVPGRQELVSVEEFAGKLRAAKEAQQDRDFLVFARVEALIAGWGMPEALRRAQAYTEAGADGIVIHSKASTPEEVFTFARQWKGKAPLVAIPTTYYRVTAEELEREGFSMVIYANHGLRAAIRAVDSVLKTIREAGTTAPVEDRIAGLQEVFDLQGMKDVKEDEKKFLQGPKVQAVIPAARDHRFQTELKGLLQDRPLCMVEIAGRSLLDRQLDLLHSVGVQEVCVVGGHLHERIRAEGVRVLFNPDYAECGCAGSILYAREEMRTDTLVVYSDILFDRQIPERLLQSPHEITGVVDRAYRSLPFRAKALDRVQMEAELPAAGGRRLHLTPFQRIRRIGQGLPQDEADHEFIGMVFLRKSGLDWLKQGWEEALARFSDRPFYEAPSAKRADLTDLLMFLLERGYPVYGMEIEQGWSEIHSLEDYRRVQAHFEAPPVLQSKVPAFLRDLRS